MKYKEIPNLGGRYLISTKGVIRDLHKNRLVNYHMSGVSRRNYPQVTLYYKGKKFTKRVHSWMAITFLNHVYGDRTIVVDHIDNNPMNNDLSNLQIISMKENNNK